MSSAALSGSSEMNARTASVRASADILLGNEPAIDPNGRATAASRQAINLRWLSGTVLTGIGGAALLAAALLISMEGSEIPLERADIAVAGGQTGAQPGAARKSDKLVRPADVIGARNGFKAPMTLKVGDKEVIKVRNFIRVATALSTVSGPLASEVPAFNPLKLMTEDTSSEKGPEPVVESGDAEVSLVKADLSQITFEAHAGPALSDDDVAAQIQEERRAIQESGRRPYLPLPAHALMTRTLRPELPAEANAFLPTPLAANFSTIEVRVVPENVTAVNKTPPSPTATQPEEKITAVNRGETVEGILRAHGASPEEVRLIVTALARGQRNYAVGEGRTVRLLIAPPSTGRSRSQILRVTVADEETVESIAALNDDYAYVAAPLPQQDKKARQTTADDDDDEDDGTGLRLYQSFYETALRQQIPREVIDELVRVVSNEIDFQRRASAADHFEAFFTDDDGDLDLFYAAITVGGETRRYYRYANPDEHVADYYDPDGKSARKFLLRKPVMAGDLGSGFGPRYHPILRYARMHNGVDWNKNVGAPILAAGNGKIVKAGWDSGYGRRVEIEHANGYLTTYSHMSNFGKGIAEGQRVRQGQVIGYVGSTGLSTGPHLHYEVIVNG
ncbi:MAG: peptidoglycan DD-metalloendopeptidase family protein, partial [Beijerinckiaceae bacterium]